MRDAAFQAQQRMLGVGVRLQRRPSAHLLHLPALRAHLQALEAGFADPTHGLEIRLARLRERLWRSPLYLRWLRERGHSPRALQTLEDLSRFPLMDRETFGASWRDAPALGLEPLREAELTVAISSGSTGQAIPVARDGYDALHMWAVLRFWLAHARVSLPARPRMALLCTLPGGLEYSTRLPHFERGALHRISALTPSPEQRLSRIQPAILSSDPAGFHWVCGRDLSVAPRFLMSSAQHLPAAQRRELTERFDAPLINCYATTEAGPIAWECLREPGVFHALQPDVWLESVAGEVVVTRLRDSAVPLLRYRTGDAAEVTEHACTCGFRGRSLLGFVGRRACHFIRVDGARVDAWNLIWLFKDLPLVGFRMTQRAHESFELQVDRPLPMTEALLAERLEVTLTRLGWRAPQVEIQRVQRVEHGAKPEPFVCQLSA